MSEPPNQNARSSWRRNDQPSTKRGREPSFDRGHERHASYGSRDREEKDRHRHGREPSRHNGRGYYTENRRRDDNRRDYAHDNKRGRKDSWGGSHRDEWICTECQTWNDISQSSCDRCGRPQPRGRIETRDRQNLEVDEFGRKSWSSGETSGGPRWPPPFDRRSATYVFDSRSGMFYHASTQFFFDPTRKLYYGNKEQKYYSYRKGESTPFKEVKTEVVQEEKGDNEKAEVKPKIAISLKTKVLSSCGSDQKKPKDETKVAGGNVYRTQRNHDANIDRWSERGREIKGKDLVVRTKTGKPVCLLCKRKFANLENLERHENVSEMHKSNLARHEKHNIANEGTEPMHYRDRAFERRLLHDADDQQVSEILAEEMNAPAEVEVEHALLDESNVGNRMLQKLGWKSGTNLGRHAGTEISDGALQKDWERIEQLSKSQKR